MDYLQLVNDAMEEAGQGPALTSGDFSNPPEPMQAKFKKWVAQAWREIQMDRGEWEYMVTNYVTTLHPRVYVEDGTRATAPLAGHTYITVDSLQELELAANPTTISGSWAAGTAKAYLDLVTGPEVISLGEFSDETSPSILNTDVFSYKGKGEYDLAVIIPGLEEPLLGEFYIQPSRPGSKLKRLHFCAWAKWAEFYEVSTIKAEPQIFTTCPNGTYKFWPDFDTSYKLKVGAISAPTELLADTDTPDIPDKFHFAVLWKAFMFWAQFDRQASEEIRGYKNYRFYKREMDRYLKPNFSWEESRFNG